jgi:pimeloyl-ACP methyl ester carboxylesterase
MTSKATVSAVRSADGTEIAYERVGSGPALVLIDPALGFSGFRHMGSLPSLLASDFTVFTYDRRGRGESADTPPYAVEREVDDLESLIAAAGGSAYVYGFSSGAVLGLHAAARGLAVTKLALLEPPIGVDDRPPTPELPEKLTALVAAGRRGDAVVLFNTAIGVPEEMVAGMRDAPFWPALESVAHTLVYDLAITGSLPLERLSAITIPALVVDSSESDGGLRAAAEAVAAALPNGSHRRLTGEWHGVAPEDLAAALGDFFSAK